MGDFFRHLVVRLGLAMVGLVIFGIAFGAYALYDLGFGHHVRINIDNTSGRPISVSLDDREIATVPAGQSTTVTSRHGEYRVTATSGGETIYDETHELVKPSKGNYSTFIFNPDGQGRYWKAEMIYGTQLPVIPPPAMTIESVVRSLTQEIPLIDPPAKWTRADADYTLEEQFPTEIKTSNANLSTSKFGIRRLSMEDYEIVAAARKNATKPNGEPYTEAELQSLEDRVLRIYREGEYAGQ